MSTWECPKPTRRYMRKEGGGKKGYMRMPQGKDLENMTHGEKFLSKNAINYVVSTKVH